MISISIQLTKQKTNSRHRPIGLGIQGLADVYFKMNIPYDSVQAQIINKQIFETIYFGALEASMELAADKGVFYFPRLALSEAIPI